MTVRSMGLIASAGAIVAGALAAPFALRELDFFRLRRIEIRGLQYHSDQFILESLGLAPDHNIFQSTRAVRRRVEALPGVLRSQVHRRMPGTLSILVRERQPVAFVPGPDGLVAVDADAVPLPYDPALTGLDVPVLARADSQLTRTLAMVLAADPSLYADVETAERVTGDVVILHLGSQQVLWRGVPSMRQIRAVEAVRRNLSASDQRFDLLDARFADAIVVRRSPA